MSLRGNVVDRCDGEGLSLVPGPSRMTPAVLAAYGAPRGSPDIEDAFWDDYLALEKTLQGFLGTQNALAMQSGEAMLALWGAMKSVIQPGDSVVCAANGLFGEGFASMAEKLQADVHVVKGDWREPMDVDALIAAIKDKNPKLVTMVHCETPSGLLNPLEGVGQAVHEHTTDGLFLVDFVSSAIGAPLNIDALQIDLGLLGPHKALSGPPSIAITSVSDRAWRRINEVQYIGYDALQPFFQVEQQTPRLFPYTHNWHAVGATIAACDAVVACGGIEANIARHEEVAQFCRAQAAELGLKLYCNEKAASPTVTALEVPSYTTWPELKEQLRAHKLFLGGSYGPLNGKVFRVGHMGSQADKPLVAEAMKVLGQVLKKLR